MNTELIGLTRGHVMGMAAELTISGRAENVLELLRRAQWSALVAAVGVQEARRIMTRQSPEPVLVR
jgi:hypothetical protein